MKELKYTENMLEHTWDTATENPARGVCNHRGLHTTGDSTAQRKAAVR